MSSTASQLPAPGETNGDLSAHFILIEPKPERGRYQAPLITAWNRAISSYFANETNPPFTVLEGKLEELDANLLECDCVVSPANSFGIMDGGFDDVLSVAFKGDTDGYWTLTNAAQDYIKREWHGYLPPGSCVVVPIPPNVAGSNNPWKARFLAVLPTMRVPDDVSWHKDIVYHCVWSLQVAIENWNRSHAGEDVIKRVLMTGLATGFGCIKPEKCARQTILAVQHFRQPVLERPRWIQIIDRENEIVDTAPTYHQYGKGTPLGTKLGYTHNVLESIPESYSKPGRRKPALLIQAWNQAIALHFADKESVPFTVLEGGLLDLNAQLLECDCTVSPANSFGIMDGGGDTGTSQITSKRTSNENGTAISHQDLVPSYPCRPSWLGLTTLGKRVSWRSSQQCAYQKMFLGIRISSTIACGPFKSRSRTGTRPDTQGIDDRAGNWVRMCWGDKVCDTDGSSSSAFPPAGVGTTEMGTYVHEKHIAETVDLKDDDIV